MNLLLTHPDARVPAALLRYGLLGLAAWPNAATLALVLNGRRRRRTCPPHPPAQRHA